mmetsp:Transcript_13053/g.35616  ORF Transcript_13053/g.35616 Transcript_13053/m.35616 type:complete len:281 (-) Transcript_13053:293-1135(-)
MLCWPPACSVRGRWPDGFRRKLGQVIRGGLTLEGTLVFQQYPRPMLAGFPSFGDGDLQATHEVANLARLLRLVVGSLGLHDLPAREVRHAGTRELAHEDGAALVASDEDLEVPLHDVHAKEIRQTHALARLLQGGSVEVDTDHRSRLVLPILKPSTNSLAVDDEGVFVWLLGLASSDPDKHFLRSLDGSLLLLWVPAEVALAVLVHANLPQSIPSFVFSLRQFHREDIVTVRLLLEGPPRQLPPNIRVQVAIERGEAAVKPCSASADSSHLKLPTGYLDA